MVDFMQVLLRFHMKEADFVIGDPTEMEPFRALNSAHTKKSSGERIFRQMAINCQ